MIELVIWEKNPSGQWTSHMHYFEWDKVKNSSPSKAVFKIGSYKFMLILKSTCQTSSDLFHFLFYLFLHIDIFLECVTFSYIDGYKKKGNPFTLRIKRMECLNANHSEHKQNKLIWEKSIKKVYTTHAGTIIYDFRYRGLRWIFLHNLMLACR